MSSEAKLGALQSEAHPIAGERTVFKVLLAISFCHLLNDSVQSLLPAIYPLLKNSYHLDFGQVGLIALTLQLTASLLQPLVGMYTDRHPMPYSLAIGMGVTLFGMLVLAMAPSYAVVLLGAGFLGVGSSVFHPESSRVARMASGGQHGMAQSLFQTGGNAGSALGPLLGRIVSRMGQTSIAWFSSIALLGIVLLTNIGAWAKTKMSQTPKVRPGSGDGRVHAAVVQQHMVLPGKTIAVSLAILMALMFSKFFYLASLSSYYTFYLINKFHVSVPSAQLHLSLFLGAVAAGTIIGGPIGDKFGRKYVIWVSILGVLPFTLVMPHVNLFWTSVLSVVIGLILASAFSAILVYAQDLLPGRVGMISGLFFGFAFGAGGVGAALLGMLADAKGIDYVYQVCAFLPAIGILTAFLPHLEPGRKGPAQPAPPEICEAGI